MVISGTALRTRVTRLIDHAKVANTATLKTISYTQGDYGGYESNTETTDSTSSINCLNANNVRISQLKMSLGNIRIGDVRLVIRYDVSINQKDLVTWKSDDYQVEDVNEPQHNDVVLCKVITLSRVIDSGS